MECTHRGGSTRREKPAHGMRPITHGQRSVSATALPRNTGFNK